MASKETQQQRRLQLRPPRGSSSGVLAAPTLLCFLVLFLAVFAQPSSCRPLPRVDDNHHPSSNNNGVVKAGAANVILLPAPAETTTMVVAAPSSVPRAEDEEDRRRHQLAGGRHQWLLNKKPRGRAPPSAPSKRTN